MQRINFDVATPNKIGALQTSIERPNHQELTLEELQGLRKLQSIIDHAITDGKISYYERELIGRMIHEGGKVLGKDITMVIELIRDKVDSGLITNEWDN